MKKQILIFLFVILISDSFSQVFFTTELAKIPMKISNNAVTGAVVNGKQYVYSFAGIDSTKNYTGINLKAFRYDVLANIWDTIPDLPDSRGKIAAGASTIDSVIYIIGGYHVYLGGSEVSSNKVHRFNTKTNMYLSDATPIPVAIDDHVQAVWKDSLIFVITGWSNSGNVPNVQIYNPITNAWSVGTSTPNNNDYKSFGASGTIVNNTIYYFGGASMGSNFPAQNVMRIGEINPLNPSQITWRKRTPNASLKTYRSICVESPQGVHWLGGSGITYNYNGIAYNGSGGVTAWNKNILYRFGDSSMRFEGLHYDSIPMDLRGYADFGPSQYIAGGMTGNQEVTNKTFRLEWAYIGLNEVQKESFEMFPNPTKGKLNLRFKSKGEKTIVIYNILGKEVIQIKSITKTIQIVKGELSKGVYFVSIQDKNSSLKHKVQKLVVN